MTSAGSSSRDLAGLTAEFNRTRNIAGKPMHSLCYAPSTQMSFNTDGTVAVCCMSRHEPIGNVMNEGLMAIWRGPKMQTFRKALAKDAFPRGCEQCRWELEMGNSANNPLRQFDDLAIDPKVEWPTRLEFAMSNLCNLGCIHCFGELSSVVRAQEGRPPMAKAYGDSFFEELRLFLPHLKTASFVGGEPFLQPECFRVWEMLIEMKLKPSIAITTNGTVFNDRVRRVLDQLPYHINLSLDSITPRTFERVRVNARATNVFRNVQLFLEHKRGVFGRPLRDHEYLINLNFVLMKRNWRDLAAGFLFAEEHQCGIWVTPLVSPKHLNVFELSQRTLEAMARVFDKQTKEIESRLVRNRRQWTELVNMVHKAAEDAGRREKAGPSRSTNQARPMHEAWAAMSRGDEEAALAAAARTTPDDMLYTTSLVFRAELVMRRNRLDESDALLAEADRLGDKSGDLYLRRAWLRLRQHRSEDCIQDVARLDKAIASNPKTPAYLVDGSLHLHANIDEGRRDLGAALRSWEELVRRNPERGDLAHELARVRGAMAAALRG